MTTTVVSTRIKKKDRDTLRDEGIDVSGESRKHLEQIAASVRRRKALERLHKAIDKMMPPARRGYGSRSVREDRDNN